MSDTEQWERGGDCSKCRRRKYCTKPCKENVRATNRTLYGLVARAFGRAFAESMNSDKVE